MTHPKPEPWQTREYRDLDFHVRMRRVVVETTAVAVDYEVRDVIGTDADGDRLLFASAGGGESDQSHDPDAVVPAITGVIKWDGCSHNTFADDGYMHGCSREDMTRLGTLYDRLFTWALEMLPGNEEHLQ